jgi:signal transduction histidine kinase
VSAIPRELLASWPGRWRHPDLAVAVAEADGDLPSGLAIDLVLGSLSEPHSTLGTADRLIDGMDFDLVETLLSEDVELGHGGAAIRIADRLESARRDVDARIALERATLAARERRAAPTAASTAPPLDPAESPKQVWRAIEKWKTRVEEAEKRRRDELEELLARADGPESWRGRVASCIGVHEFAVAERLIAQGPDGDDGEDLPVPRPRNVLPRRPASLRELLDWYAPGADLSGEFDAFLLHPDDSAGRSLVEALGGLAERIDGETTAAFAAALEDVLGRPARPRVEQRKSGCVAWLFGLGDERFPQLFVRSRAGTALWISDGAPPPDDLQEPIVWFVRDLAPATPGPPRTAVVGPETLLRLLARNDAAATPRADWRRTNFLRAVLIQFQLKDVIEEADELCGQDGSVTRRTLAAVLDLWNAQIEGSALEILLYLTGGHPAVAREALDDLLGKLDRDRRIGARDVEVCRSPQARERYASAVLRAVAEDSEAHAVLLAVLAFYADDRKAAFTPGEVAAGIAELTDGQEPAAADGIAVAEALERLRAVGLLDGVRGSYTLPSSGLSECLAYGVARIDERAREALREAAPTARLNRALRDMATVKLLLRDLTHHADTMSAALIAELDGIAKHVGEHAHDGIDRMRDYARQSNGDRLRDALAQATVERRRLDMRSLIEVAVNELVSRVEVNFEGDDGVELRGNWWQLRSAVTEVLRNAVRAAERSSGGGGGVEIRLSRQAAPPSVAGDPETGQAWVVIDVEDSGLGMTQAQRSALIAGDRFSAYGGHGVGLASARDWIQEHGGDVEILDSSDRLGGAHVRIRLPCSDGADGAGEADQR